MTILEAIELADAIKPNAFDTATKIRWLSEVEGQIQADIWLLAPEEWVEYDENTPTDTQLLVTGGHSKIYRAYLCAMIDLANGEYDHYANTSAVANDYLQEYELWYARVYHPADTWREIRKGCYFTAYGLAVKHGYDGTEEEWLETLHGVSPTVAVVETDDGKQLVITDVNGEKVVDLTSTQPQMLYGVEYATAGKYNGKTVYSQIVDCGAMPSAGAKTVYLYDLDSSARIIRCTGEDGGSNGITLPVIAGSTQISVNAQFDSMELFHYLYLYNSTGVFASDHVYVQIWYTKD